MKKIIITIIIITRVVKQTQTHTEIKLCNDLLNLKFGAAVLYAMLSVCGAHTYLFSLSLFALYLCALHIVYASFFFFAFVAVPFHCYNVINNVYEFRIFFSLSVSLSLSSVLV